MQDEKPARATVDAAICNCLALRQAARHATQFYDLHLAPEGLTTSQYSILAKLARLGPQSINALAATMVMDRTTTTRAVRPLERDRLVAVEPGEDGRTRVVRLTPAGEKRAKAAAVRWREAQRAFEAAYGAGEAVRLRVELARVVATV
ncbi:MAG TPA: MarR family transcriptional regulator [Xanthobacteraceae bacterium]